MIVEGKICWDTIKDNSGYTIFEPAVVLFKIFGMGDCWAGNPYSTGFCLLVGKVVWEGEHAGQIAIGSGSTEMAGGNHYVPTNTQPVVGGDAPTFGSCIDMDDIYYADVDWESGTFKVDLPETICGFSGGDGYSAYGYPTAGIIDPMTPTVAAAAFNCERPSTNIFRDDNCVIIEDIVDLPTPYGAQYWYSFFKINGDGSLTFKKRFRSSYTTENLSSARLNFYGGRLWHCSRIGTEYAHRLEGWDCGGSSPSKVVDSVLYTAPIRSYSAYYRFTGCSTPYYQNGSWWVAVSGNMTGYPNNPGHFIVPLSGWNFPQDITGIAIGYVPPSARALYYSYMIEGYASGQGLCRKYIDPSQLYGYGYVWTFDDSSHVSTTIEPYGIFESRLLGQYFYYLYYGTNGNLHLAVRRWSNGSLVLRKDMTAEFPNFYGQTAIPERGFIILGDGSMLIKGDHINGPAWAVGPAPGAYYHLHTSGSGEWLQWADIGAPPAIVNALGHSPYIIQAGGEDHHKYVFGARWFCNNLSINFVQIEPIHTYCTNFMETCGTGMWEKGIDVRCVAGGANAAGAIVFAQVSINGAAAELRQAQANAEGIARFSTGCLAGSENTLNLDILDVYYEGYQWDNGPCDGGSA